MSAASPVAWDDIQRAVYNWFSASTGLPTSWSFQKRPQDDVANGYGVLTVMSVDFDPTMDVDEPRMRETDGELYADQIGARYVEINCQVVSASQAFDGHAQNLLSRAQGALTLTEYANALDALGVTVIGSSAITNISSVAGAGFESRATMDVTFTVRAITQPDTTDGYFDHAVLRDDDNGSEQTIGPAP